MAEIRLMKPSLIEAGGTGWVGTPAGIAGHKPGAVACGWKTTTWPFRVKDPVWTRANQMRPHRIRRSSTSTIPLASRQSGLSQSLREDVADLPIIGSDRDPGAIRMSIANAERAGVGGMVRFEQKTLEDIEPPTEFGAWCSNAPYGRRVGNSDALTGLFVQIGKLARGPFSEWRVALLLAEQSHVKALQSATTEILKTRVGGIQVGLYGIEG